MRLLHVFPSFEVGGQQMRMAALANQMAEDGVHNLILSLGGDFSCAERFSGRVSWEAVPSLLQKRGLWGRVSSNASQLAALSPDMLITYNWGAIEWAAANHFAHLRHIHIEDGFGQEEADRQLRRRVLFRRLVLSRKSEIVFPSKTLFALARDVWKLPEARLHYIPNGIDLESGRGVDSAAARSTYRLPQDKIIIGTLATLRREKNLMRLIDAFAGLDQRDVCHLVIAGAGTEEPMLKAYVASNDLSNLVSFPGFVEQPLDFLPAFDIFSLSSDTEQMPLSVLEAMACGLPVASTDVGDVKEMVATEGTAFVMGNDKESLTSSLERLVQDGQLRRSLGQVNALRVEKEYSFQKMVSSYKNLFIYG